MNEKKPNVFPTKEQIEEANAVGTQIALNQELGTERAVPTDPIENPQPPAGELSAAEEMRRKTEEQIRLRNEAIAKTKGNGDEASKMREQLRTEMETKQPNNNNQSNDSDKPMSYEDMVRLQRYLEQIDEKRSKEGNNQNIPPTPPSTPTPPLTPPPTPPFSDRPSSMNNDDNYNSYIEKLSQPQYDAAFDVIPLPSEGKLYSNRKKEIKVAYMTTMDENILTSPNLLTSGDFLEILLNRKILEPDLRYKDLVEGDRDAIMLWLRATGFGHMYPIVINDEKDEPFETEIDLNTIKTINLNVEPDKDGLFHFTLPISGLPVRFKLLTIGEIEEINEIVEYEVETLKLPVNNTNTYELYKQIVSIGDETDKEKIKKIVDNMRIGDSGALRDYINTINCGVDMNITVGTPGGGSINTFLPLNLKFFWPKLGV